MPRIESSIEIDAPPDEVWRELIDFESYPEWNPLILAASGELIAGHRLELRVRIGPLTPTIHPTLLDVVPGARLSWRGTLLGRAVFEGVHSFVLEALPGDRTRLTHGERFGGFLRPVLGRFLKFTVSGFDAMDSALKARVEAGRPRRMRVVRPSSASGAW